MTHKDEENGVGMRGKSISHQQKIEILRLSNLMMPIMQIVKELNISYRTVRRWADPDNHITSPIAGELENCRQLTVFEKLILCEIARLAAWPVKDLSYDLLSHLFERTRKSDRYPSERTCRRALISVGLEKYLMRREEIETGTLSVHMVPVSWEVKKYLSESYVVQHGYILLVMERNSGYIHMMRINALTGGYLISRLKSVITMLYRDFRVTVGTICFVTHMKEDELLSTALNLRKDSAINLCKELALDVVFDQPTNNGAAIFLGRFHQKGDLGKVIRREERFYNYGIPLEETSYNLEAVKKRRRILFNEMIGFSRVHSRLQSHLMDEKSRIKWARYNDAFSQKQE